MTTRTCITFGRLFSLCLVLLALLACGTTKVIREPSAGGRPQSAVSKPKPGASVRVEKGQTLYRIAVNNGISPMDLALWNRIAPPYTIYPGQVLKLYPASTAQTGSSSPASRPSPGRPTATPPKPSTSSPAAVVASTFKWRWPADGQVIATFAPGEATRQGIDIAGSGGQPVRAAADGVVVYSGTGLVGYGELIIVKHDEEWLSAYGHNRRRMVNEGQIVKAGQQIAEMGRSGAARDMLHFEIRHNGKPVDPQLYLPRK